MLLDIIRPKIGLAALTAPARFCSKPLAPLIALCGRDAFRLQDAFEGVQIFGGTGSGKSSGSGKALALAYLRAGFGGLVLCVKPDEAARWIEYARLAGRSAHVKHFRPDGQDGFNFLDYEVHRPDGIGRETFNLVNLLLKIVEASQLAEGPSGGSGENPFWQRALREMLANTVEPLQAAYGRLRIDELMEFIASAPTTPDQVRNEDWREKSFFYQTLCKSIATPLGVAVPEHASRASAVYWFKTYAELDPKTRSNITATLTGTLAPFLRGVLHDRFCTNTSIVPELTHEGAILIVDFPVKQWGDAAIVAANIIKYQWQRATERRVVTKKTRPVFLWADECQFVLSDYDMEFQSTARSSMAATVYITQNLPTYFSRLRSRDPRATAEAMLGNFQTKIFHANTDPMTNQLAADMIGKDVQRRFSGNWSSNSGTQQSENRGTSWGFNRSRQQSESWSSNWGRQYGESVGRHWGANSSSGSSSGAGGSSSSSSFGSSSGGNSGSNWSRSTGGGYSFSDSTGSGENYGENYSTGTSFSQGHSNGGGWSEQMDYIVQTRVFAANLRKGGKPDKRKVDGIVVQGGRRFKTTGAHWLPVTFKQ